jgi:hypothetical protein
MERYDDGYQGYAVGRVCDCDGAGVILASHAPWKRTGTPETPPGEKP